jgi:hypothetical protein
MATTLQLPMQQKRTSVAGRAPTTGDIEAGQLAINLVDRKLFTKDESNQIVVLGIVSSDLSTVAFTGAYADLTGKPTIPDPYTLPAATTTVLGGIKVATDGSVSINAGVLSAAIINIKGEFGVTQTGNVVLTRADLGLDILDSNNKILPEYLPDSITGAMVYKGTYNASTNTPTIPDAATENLGWLYVTSVAGTFTPTTGSPISLLPGDWLLSDGTQWQKVPAASSDVLSINGQTGTVVINASNLPGLSDVGKTGQYTDLLGKPSLATVATSGAYTDLSGTPVLAPVATGGSYNDLTDLPPDPSIIDVGVNVTGNPIIQPVAFIFTRACEFPQNFAGSQVVASMVTGTVAQARIMQALAAAPATFTQVGTLSYNVTTHTATFSTINPTVVDFAIGDVLRYEWISSGIASISITLTGHRT